MKNTKFGWRSDNVEKCEIFEILRKWHLEDNHFCLCSIRKFCENSDCPYHSEKPEILPNQKFLRKRKRHGT